MNEVSEKSPVSGVVANLCQTLSDFCGIECGCDNLTVIVSRLSLLILLLSFLCEVMLAVTC